MPLCGSVVWPNQCWTVRSVGRGDAPPPMAVVIACNVASSMIGMAAGDAPAALTEAATRAVAAAARATMGNRIRPDDISTPLLHTPIDGTNPPVTRVSRNSSADPEG